MLHVSDVHVTFDESCPFVIQAIPPFHMKGTDVLFFPISLVKLCLDGGRDDQEMLSIIGILQIIDLVT